MTGLEILAIGSAVAGVGSSLASGFQANAASKRSARRKRQDAAERREVGAIERDLALETGRRLEGEAVAEAAAGGFTTDGTVADAVAGIARATAMDAENARYGAARDARRLEIEAAEDRAQGRASLFSAGADAFGTALTAGASLLKPTSAASGLAKGQRTGPILSLIHI